LNHWMWRSGCLMLVAACLTSVSSASESMVESDTISFGGASFGNSSCDCASNRQPPWHGNVAGPCCNRPCCPPPTLFHADPWGQLEARREAREHCVELPSAFPRFDGWRKGHMPSPRPLSLPRCHHCGMPVYPGM
jgi:hypothetical protein